MRTIPLTCGVISISASLLLAEDSNSNANFKFCLLTRSRRFYSFLKLYVSIDRLNALGNKGVDSMLGPLICILAKSTLHVYSVEPHMLVYHLQRLLKTSA